MSLLIPTPSDKAQIGVNGNFYGYKARVEYFWINPGASPLLPISPEGLIAHKGKRNGRSKSAEMNFNKTLGDSCTSWDWSVPKNKTLVVLPRGMKLEARLPLSVS